MVSTGMMSCGFIHEKDRNILARVRSANSTCEVSITVHAFVAHDDRGGSLSLTGFCVLGSA